ncbi:MAG: DUF192 domain-containing protein [Pseudomonadales bacterium]|nr:DUF192 domain-containing protein [Pseudomonadales bacterium]
MFEKTFQALRVRKAHSWWGRLRGLLGRLTLPLEEALWLKPCSSIHTIGMMFTIDVVFLNSANIITGLKRNVRPFNFAFAPKGCDSVLELAAGGANHYGLEVGDELKLD